MKQLRIVKAAAVGLACLGMIMPEPRVASAATKSQQHAQAAKAAQAAKPTDAALGAQGTLNGLILDEQGVGIDSAVVLIQQGERQVASSVTDAQGQFTVKGLRGGVYTIVAGHGTKTVRLWAARTAPPSADERVVIVSPSQVVRGQGLGGLDIITLTTVTASITAAVLAGLALDEINDLEDELEEQRPQSP